MGQKMKAATITAIKEVEVREYDMPEIQDDEVLIELKACAICTIEQRIYLGIKDVGGYPVVGGHEGSGVVKAVGKNVKHCKVGDHAILTDPYCGTCYFCRKGSNSQCSSGIDDAVYRDKDGKMVLCGYLAEYVKARYDRVIVVDEKVPFEQIALTEPVACVLHSVRKAQIDFGDFVLVVGAGIMGLLHTQLAKKRGAIVAVAEIDPDRREKALSMGADYAFDPTAENAVEYLKSISGGLGANVVFNTTAVSSSWEMSLKMLAPYGKLLAYSSQHPDNPIPISMGKVHSTEISIVGTVSPDEFDMYTAAKLIAEGIVDVKPVIQHIVPIEDAAEAFRKATTPGTYRVVVTMNRS